MYKEILNLRVFRIVIITTPLFALLGAAPAFVFNMEWNKILTRVLMISSITLVFWVINIGLLWISMKFGFEGKHWIRYILSSSLCALLMYSVSQQILPFRGNEIPVEVSEHFPVKMMSSRGFLFPLIQFQSINIIIIVLLEMILLRERKQKVEAENNQLKIANLEAKHNQLKQQLHPHFLFNSLNTLRSLIKRSPERAEEYLVKLSDMLRFSINSNSQTLINLEDELELSTNYLNMQKVRFGNALNFDIDIVSSMQLKGKVPVYSIQLLVENAIKHNILTNNLPLYISIKGDKESKTVTVTNNLQPKLNVEESSGVGLSNLAERYRLLNNEEIIISKANDEFMVTIKVMEYESGNN